MFLRNLYKLLLSIFLLIAFSNHEIKARELSIKDLELRKKLDQERLLERKKRGLKKSNIEIKFSTEVIFLSKERKIPPVLSNLDPILNDEGFYGIKLANEDNLTTGNFLGHDYKFKFIQVALGEDLVQEFIKLIESGSQYFIVDLRTDEILELTKLEQFKEIIMFNTRSRSDKLRNEFS